MEFSPAKAYTAKAVQTGSATSVIYFHFCASAIDSSLLAPPIQSLASSDYLLASSHVDKYVAYALRTESRRQTRIWDPFKSRVRLQLHASNGRLDSEVKNSSIWASILPFPQSLWQNLQQSRGPVVSWPSNFVPVETKGKTIRKLLMKCTVECLTHPSRLSLLPSGSL